MSPPRIVREKNAVPLPRNRGKLSQLFSERVALMDESPLLNNPADPWSVHEDKPVLIKMGRKPRATPR